MLFDAGIPEAVIQKRTGHKSVKALRCYERTTPAQNLQVSTILHKAASTLEDETNISINMTLDEMKAFKELDYTPFLMCIAQIIYQPRVCFAQITYHSAMFDRLTSFSSHGHFDLLITYLVK